MNFLYPVPTISIITQTFEEHVRRAQANGWTNYNGGIDFAVNTGTPIKAAQAGKVKEVRQDATGYGTHIRIEHKGGYLSIYAHLLNYSVSAGDTVTAGQVIGKSDNTGNSTGPHLHFEVRLGGRPIDPASMLVKTTAALADASDTDTMVSADTMGAAPAQFPALPKAKIMTAVLNVRTGPGTDNPAVTNLPGGTVVEVIRQVIKENDIWLQIGHKQYLAMRYAGDIYAQWN
ncbi:MAG: M23 family metallopeptidase [Anaerolineales bacterium]|nr:M23 family metallopeptidase [Anaerolineales bacterium]